MATVAFADEKTKQSYLDAQKQFTTLSKQLGRVNAQSAVSEREAKVIGVTLSELNATPSETKAYLAVGKMFLRQDLEKIKNNLTEKKEGFEKEVVSYQRASSKLESDINDAKSLMKDILASAKIQD